jgi:hypothetical protein
LAVEELKFVEFRVLSVVLIIGLTSKLELFVVDVFEEFSALFVELIWG